MVIFTNLHHKLSLLIRLFYKFFSECFPSLDPLGISFFVRILLTFFQKNQILNPEFFKPDTKLDSLSAKRDHDEFCEASENARKSSASLSDVIEHLRESYKNEGSPRDFKAIYRKKYLKGTGNERKKKEVFGNSDGLKNVFSFIHKHMKHAALELLNLSEVTNLFLEKMFEYELQGKDDFFHF